MRINWDTVPQQSAQHTEGHLVALCLLSVGDTLTMACLKLEIALLVEIFGNHVNIQGPHSVESLLSGSSTPGL